MVDSIGLLSGLGNEAIDAIHGCEIGVWMHQSATLHVEGMSRRALDDTCRYGWGVIAMMVIWRLSGP